MRSSMLSDWNLRHWSGQCVETLQIQHLCFSWLLSSVLIWLIDRWLESLLTGAMARMRDFISDVIQLSSPWRVAGFPSCSRSRDHTFLSSGPILRSTMDNIWLLSMSPGTPTSFTVLYERLTRCTRSQNLETFPSCSGLNTKTRYKRDSSSPSLS